MTFSFFGIAHVTNQTNPEISSTLPAVNINYLCALFVFTRLLLDEIYHFIELPFDWLIGDAMFVSLVDKMILGFCYSDFDMGNG